MYEADVPVLNQSPQARVQASEAGLRQVLGRLTGQGESGLTIRVTGTSADRLMTRFSYHSVVVNGQRQPRIKLSFNPAQTLATVRNSGLPVWGVTRPSVKLYLLSQEADGSWVALSQSHPVREAMVRAAWVRGLVLTFPSFNTTVVPVSEMLDAVNPNKPVDPLASLGEDSATESVEETAPVEGTVVAGSSATLRASCEPEAPEPPPEPFLPGVVPKDSELVLVGEIRAAPSPQAPVSPPTPSEPQVLPGPAFTWAIGTDRGVIGLPVGDPIAQGTQLVERIADEMGRRFAVRWVNPSAQTLRVASVTKIPAYAELMRYLGRQEVFSRVDLREAGPEHFEFSVITPADPEELARVFRVEGRLLQKNVADESAGKTQAPCDAPLREGAEEVVEPLEPGTPTEDGIADTGLPVFVWQN